LSSKGKIQQDKLFDYNVTLMRVRVTVVAVEYLYILHVMIVCLYSRLIYSASTAHARIILSSVTFPAVPYFPKLYHKRHDFRWRNEHKICVFLSFTTWSETFPIIRRNQRDIVVNV